jgi:hypothetical protein
MALLLRRRPGPVPSGLASAPAEAALLLVLLRGGLVGGGLLVEGGFRHREDVGHRLDVFAGDLLAVLQPGRGQGFRLHQVQLFGESEVGLVDEVDEPVRLRVADVAPVGGESFQGNVLVFDLAAVDRRGGQVLTPSTDAARIPCGDLNPVEGDLGHHLGPDVHDVTLPVRLELQEAAGLPFKGFLRHPLQPGYFPANSTGSIRSRRHVEAPATRRYAGLVRTFLLVARQLQRLNRGLTSGRVVAYSVYRDEDGDEVADVLWVLPEPEGETWPMEVLDGYCERVSDALIDLVKFAYCTFHSESEHAQVGVAGWEPVPAGTGGG